MDSAEFSKYMKDLQEKANRYDKLSLKYVKVSASLIDLAKELQKLAAELDPVLTVRTRETSNINYKELSEEVFKLMQSGTHISSTFLANTYQNLSYSNVQYLFQLVSKLPSVKTRKDGRMVYLFV